MSRSEYYPSLSGDIKLRYDEKMKLTDGVDPYALRIDELSEDVSFLPAVKIVDLVNYLVLTHCFYTGQQMKPYKSLQAFKYYEAGYVQQTMAKMMNTNCYVVMGKVMHSQRRNDKPLQ
ncbi:unnamed protein product, partial [Callosobruchus maculatus]